MAKALTKKERVFLKHIADGEAQIEAAKKAYDVSNNHTAYNIAVKNLKKQKFIELLDSVGATDRLAAEKIKKGFEAKKPVVTREGVIEADDNLAQLGYVKLFTKIKGYATDENDTSQGSEPLIIHAVQFTGPTQINITQPEELDQD